MEKIETIVYGKPVLVNKDVSDFINWFYETASQDNCNCDNLRTLFMNGACYYFAVILKTAFNRGEICWCYPLSHICWVDIDGTPWDIERVCISEYEDLIPVSFMGDILFDFMHVPNKEAKDVSKEAGEKVYKKWANLR